MLLAGATSLFVPHAGKLPPKPRQSSTPTTVSTPTITTRSAGVVSFETSFRLPPDLAYEPYIQEAADRYDLNPALLRAVIQTESAFDPDAVSPAGAQGLMQLMPALSAELGVSDPFDPRQNILGGARYLSEMLDSHDGNVSLALASYNAGPGAVERYRGIPPYKETRKYVKRITGLLRDAATTD